MILEEVKSNEPTMFPTGSSAIITPVNSANYSTGFISSKLQERIQTPKFTLGIRAWVEEHVANISATSLHLISVILLHSSTLPTLLSLMFGISDKTPILDMVLILWAALFAMFIQALIQKNQLIVTVITVGFMVQSVIMALIFFR